MVLVGVKRTDFLPMLVPGKAGSFPLLSKMRSKKCVCPLLGWADVACRVLVSIREHLWHPGFVAMVANTKLCCFRASILTWGKALLQPWQ